MGIGGCPILATWIKYMSAVADGGSHAYPDSVVQESILAYLMSKSSDPVVTSFNNTTDSLEAIADAIAGISAATVLGAVDTSICTGPVTATDLIMAYIKQIVTNTYRLGETACADISDPVDMTTEIVDNSILANLLTDDGDTSVYDRRIHSLEALYNGLIGSVNAVNRAIGRTQIKATTIDLHQAAGAKDLFTGTTQDVLIKSLTFRVPDINVSDDVGEITGISIQTDDTTPQVFVNSVVGAKAYLTAQAQLGWTGASLLKATKKIQLTIIGGTADADPTTCDVVCEFEAIVSGGYLA